MGPAKVPSLKFLNINDKTSLDDLLLVTFTPFQSVQERPLRQGHDIFIYLFCSCCCSSPIVHIMHTHVRRMGIMIPCLHIFDSAGQGFEYFWKYAKRCVTTFSLQRKAGGINTPSSSGGANDIISSGKISGTPPTRVLTTYRPAQAASRIATPKASVNEVFKKIEP